MRIGISENFLVVNIINILCQTRHWALHDHQLNYEYARNRINNNEKADKKYSIYSVQNLKEVKYVKEMQ